MCINYYITCNTSYFTVTTIQIVFSESIQMNTEVFGTCIVSTWPRLLNVHLATNSTGCEIKTLSVSYTDTYTTAKFFKIHINSSCEHASISCLTSSKEDHKYINITGLAASIVTPTSTITNYKTTPSHPTHNVSSPGVSPTNITIPSLCGGELKIYRITLWTWLTAAVTVIFIIY